MDKPSPKEIKWSEGGAGVTTSTAPRHIRFVPLSLDDIDNLKSSGSEIEQTFLGISIGSLVSIGTTLFTVPLPDVTRGVFITLTILFVLSSGYFAAKTTKAQQQWKQKLARYEKMAESATE